MILSRQELSTQCSALRDAGRTIVFTNGCFDIVHVGHVSYLNAARALGDVLVIGLNTDRSVRELKGPNRPVNSEQDRAIVLDALRAVDFVCLFDEDTPLELITLIQPDIVVKGGDYTPENVVGADVVRARGGRVEIIPFVAGKSTTGIIEKITRL